MMQNITLKLEKGLLQKAKLQAARQKTSMSQLMVSALKSLLNIGTDYEAAKSKALRNFRKGFRSQNFIRPQRDELHKR